MWLGIVQQIKLESILKDLNDVLHGNSPHLSLIDLVALTKEYRDADELVDFFWWLDYADEAGYEKATMFAPEMHEGLDQAITFFKDMYDKGFG